MEGLTKKQRGFVKDYVKTGNGVESALENYDTKDYSTAGNIASDNLRKPKIIKAILSIADQIPDNLLVKKHLELLNVPKITRTSVQGETVTEEESVDTQALKAGLDMAYKLKGVYAAEKRETINLDVKVNISPEMIELGKKYEDEMKKKL